VFEELATLEIENPAYNAKLGDIYYTLGMLDFDTAMFCCYVL
jgi:hypothetical protein